MRRQRNAKIVATLGPASSTPAMIDSLFHGGVDVFRLNFSHGTPADHRKRMVAIRAVEAKAGRPIGVLMDLQGPKIRIGTFAHGPVMLRKARRCGSISIPRRATQARLPAPPRDLRRAGARACSFCSTTASCASRSNTAATVTR